MALDPKLLEILACPKDKGPLLYFPDEDSLYNPRLKLRYRITDDIPIMLIDEAETVDDAEHQRLRPRPGLKASPQPSILRPRRGSTWCARESSTRSGCST